MFRRYMREGSVMTHYTKILERLLRSLSLSLSLSLSRFLSLSLCVCMCVCMCVCGECMYMYVCMYVYTRTSTRTRTHTHKQTEKTLEHFGVVSHATALVSVTSSYTVSHHHT
jgi:hypothetical protein